MRSRGLVEWVEESREFFADQRAHRSGMQRNRCALADVLIDQRMIRRNPSSPAKFDLSRRVASSDDPPINGPRPLSIDALSRAKNLRIGDG